MTGRFFRDLTDTERARAAQDHAFRVDSREAWLVAEDAWRAAGDSERGDAIRRLRTRRRTYDEQAMVYGFLEAYWLGAWAAGMEEAGRSDEVPRDILLDNIDPAPRTAQRAAALFATALELANGVRLQALMGRAASAEARRLQAGGRNPYAMFTANPQTLGYDLAMQAMGHGVSWADNHACFEVFLPSTEAWALPAARQGRGGVRRWVFESSISIAAPRRMC